MISHVPGDSWLHRRNPVTKLILATCLSVAGFLLPTVWLPWVLAATLLLVAASQGLLARLLRPLAVVTVPFGLGVLVIHGMFNPDNLTELVRVGPVVMWVEGTYFALTIVGRVVVIAVSFLLLLFTTAPRDLMVALNQRGMSPKFSYALLAALEFIPDMQRRAGDVMDAQQARGLDVNANLRRRAFAFVALLGPLISGALIAADTRAMALEARAFSRVGERTSLSTVPDTSLDRTLIWVGLAGVLAAGAARFLGVGA